jgi:hypothetical protein
MLWILNFVSLFICFPKCLRIYICNCITMFRRLPLETNCIRLKVLTTSNINFATYINVEAADFSKKFLNFYQPAWRHISEFIIHYENGHWDTKVHFSYSGTIWKRFDNNCGDSLKKACVVCRNMIYNRCVTQYFFILIFIPCIFCSMFINNQQMH